MKHRWIPIAVLALFVGAIAMAQMGPGPGPAGPRALANYLQLTPDQVTAWQQINKDTQTAVTPLQTNARDLRQQLNTALTGGSPDPAAVGRLAISLHNVQEQVRTLHEDAKSKRLALLTADQKTKLAAFEAAVQFMRQPRRMPMGNR